MKYTILFIILLFIGCNDPSKEQTKRHQDDTVAGYTLTNDSFPVEIIEAFVPFTGTSFTADNKRNLFYELTVLNNRRIPFTLQKLEIYDTKKPEAPIAEFDTDYLSVNFQRHGIDRDSNTLELKGNQFGVVNIWLSLDGSDTIPGQVFHKLIFERTKSNGETTIHPMEVALMDIPPPTEITLAAPFKKGKWMYGAAIHQGSRQITEGKTSYPQRYAIDWLMLDEEGAFVKDEKAKNENWTSYGVELLAVADGTVVDVKDGIIENIPVSGKMAVTMTRQTIAGNYIVLDIGNDVYAFYAHLIPNSLRVKKGDTVKQGQVIGLLGNSGNSDAPHLHFHLETKSKITLGGEGIPYHFKEFSQLKKFTNEEFESLLELSKIPLDNLNPSKRLNELPIGTGIVEF
ncbi:peptidoglycan DD-metalloendopeptidase family protein [Leptobacterium flavescens]|uniref:Peptidoglycan DD-metalloendopeptidase family protein n=1 Tax=Leptobacterium flavescens TaxID=472055 RepID=A0A6P0UWQ2_9FLAO|nr:M23 family metallopeptidase [Leptobacterium flavescens]NER14866.1 peptidoglycan DD-metalloendopeptidase family protein [Leptobacterium flavescens]